MFTALQKTRLPDPGYYIEYYGTNIQYPFEQPETYSIVHIGVDRCTYIHWSWGEEWCTLTWTCAPTRKKVSKIIHSNLKSERYIYFPTHEELLAFKNLKPGALVKASSDNL
jgi:hypothetical protein